MKWLLLDKRVRVNSSVEELITWLRIGTWAKCHLGAAVWLGSLQAGSMVGGCPSPCTLLEQKQSMVGIFQNEIPEWCLFALGFSSLQATKWRSQREERPGAERGLQEGFAQGWPQHLSSSFEAWKLPSTGTDGAAGQRQLGGQRAEGMKASWAALPSLPGNIWCPCGIWQQYSLLWHFLWWKEEQSNLLPGGCFAQLQGSSRVLPQLFGLVLQHRPQIAPKPGTPTQVHVLCPNLFPFFFFCLQTAERQTVASLTLTMSCSSNWTLGLVWLAASSWHHCLIFQLLEQQIAGKEQRGRGFSLFLPPHCFSLGPEHQSRFAFHWRHTLLTYDGKMSGRIRRNGG